jgi:hypothetical protein
MVLLFAQAPFTFANSFSSGLPGDATAQFLDRPAPGKRGLRSSSKDVTLVGGQFLALSRAFAPRHPTEFARLRIRVRGHRDVPMPQNN